MIQVQRICSIAAIIFCLTQTLVCPAAIAVEPKRVVLLQSFGRDFKPWSEYAKAIRTELDRQSPWPLDIIEFSLVTARAADANPEKPFVDYLNALFAKRPPDLIVSIGAPAAVFVQQHRPQLFTTTPMVIAALEQRRIQRSSLTENDTVVAVAADFPAVIENILRVLPDTKTVAVVMGASPNERFWLEELRKEFPPFADRLSFIWYNDRPFADILKHVAALPPHSAIFFFLMNVDAAGVTYDADTALQRLSAVANAPIFTHDSAYFGREIVGGPMHSVSNLGRLTVAAAVRILEGERASEVRIPASKFASPIFDWRQMQRWGIAESHLPSGSEIYFRDPTLWEKYRWQIMLIASVILAQAILIIGLMYEHRRRQIAETESLQRMNELSRVNRFAVAGEMAASIAHEIRQPLAAISFSGEAALTWLKRQIPDLNEVREALEAVIEETRRADHVLESVRAIFKRGSSARTQVNLNELVQQAMAITARSINSNNIVLDVDLTNDAPLVMGDPVQLQQVILNLVTNAVDAMSLPGHSPRVLRLRTYTAPEAVLVRITDTGPGVGQEVVEQMFQPFFTTKSSGMGIGLSICKTIIEAHGGKLTASPNNPHGMELQFSLPRYRSVERRV